MNRAQKARFERTGWKVGTASELLGLTDAEEALVEAKLKLGAVVRTLRQKRYLSQAALAKLIGSSQPRARSLHLPSAAPRTCMSPRASPRRDRQEESPCHPGDNRL